ncbi:class I SAM-dependent methyltransferase [Jejudonia soesokkakensis]|uniref:Class I SAM-dependent methyltransferase n=1 Tax=Jejudonia soesokkakensis TaxID=1323432 RepID=A0ABW2MZT9_9FLAO
MHVCPLCKKDATRKKQRINGILFLTCTHCKTLYKHPQHYVDAATEKSRYLAHHNNVEDPNFQKFVSPMVEAIVQDFPPEADGLDFGAGTGPVITKLLNDKEYSNINLYDPFFHPKIKALKLKYDFIICCEVMEHFYDPHKEFNLLHSLLKPNGKLYCKTEIIPQNTDVKDWWYIRDTTHVVFYSEENLRWIKDNFVFKELEIKEQLILFSK